MLLSDPCVHRGTSTARLPPESLPLLTLRCVHSHQLLSYVWPSLLLNLTKECHPGFLIFFFEHYNILRFALMFFFLLNCERTRKNLFRKCLGPHQSYCMPTAAARGSDVFPTFSQQRPATHPKDNHRLLTDFINSQEPEGKTDRACPSLFTLRNLMLIEHNYVLYKAAAHAQVLVIFVLHCLKISFLFCLNFYVYT